MKASTHRVITLSVALLAAVILVFTMLSVPRFFTGSPELFYTPASATLSAEQPVPVTGLAQEAALPDAQVLASKLDAILAPASDGTSFSASVRDIETGQVLYSQNAEQPGTPASSLKIATAIAALDALGGARQLATTTLLDGNTVILRGGGDVLLGDGPSNDQLTEGYAGIETLAELTAQHLAQRELWEVSVWLDDSLFADAQVNPEWEQSLFTTNNIAPVYPIAHYAGRVSAADRAAHETDSAGRVQQIFTQALETELTELAAAKETSSQPSADEPKVVADGRGAYQGGEKLAEVLSAPLSQQIKHMLLVSDNYLTEAMGRLVALEQQLPAAEADTAVERVAAEYGAENLSLIDTSGLASGNRVAPAELTELLVNAAASDNPDLRQLAYSLPISGYSGTMAMRLSSATDRGLVRAKTGSLMGVATLTGVVVSDAGRALAFSIYSFNPDGALAPHRPTIDQAVSTLHACGC
ncbi:D-alanyl-D-alanine carboxypeptidase/D-alanyl-D-alanine endopeptidase [Glutamicibacter uratoxydans]|uniref:D-alanyl-D-alanine carboxypeptidase/D-alanyl-D-alanine endopeptidase n=1 Tax=Glutamicibacter uratoxydans TaxID=43667 RepID=UPI003D6FD738